MRLPFAANLCGRCAASPQLCAGMAIPTLLAALLLTPLASLAVPEASLQNVLLPPTKPS